MVEMFDSQGLRRKEWKREEREMERVEERERDGKSRREVVYIKTRDGKGES